MGWQIFRCADSTADVMIAKDIAGTDNHEDRSLWPLVRSPNRQDIINHMVMRLPRDAGIQVLKKPIARKLTANAVSLHIEFDKFATKRSRPTPYPQCLRTEELNNELTRATQTGKTVILDAVCLEDIAPVERWGRGLCIYVKQLSFNSIDPVWHVGLNLEDEPPTDEPHRSVHLYHLKILPHTNADLIVEYPEEFHRLPKMPFSSRHRRDTSP